MHIGHKQIPKGVAKTNKVTETVLESSRHCQRLNLAMHCMDYYLKYSAKTLF